MIHVPQATEQTIHPWVANDQEAWRLMEQISERSLKRFFLNKEQLRGVMAGQRPFGRAVRRYG